MSLDADLADRRTELRRRQDPHVAGKEVVQNLPEGQLQLAAALGEQNVGLRETDRQIILEQLGVPSRQIRGELPAQGLVERVAGVGVGNSDRLDLVCIGLDPDHIAHRNQQKHDHEPGHQIAERNPVILRCHYVIRRQRVAHSHALVARRDAGTRRDSVPCASCSRCRTCRLRAMICTILFSMTGSPSSTSTISPERSMSARESCSLWLFRVSTTPCSERATAANSDVMFTTSVKREVASLMLSRVALSCAIEASICFPY